MSALLAPTISRRALMVNNNHPISSRARMRKPWTSSSRYVCASKGHTFSLMLLGQQADCNVAGTGRLNHTLAADLGTVGMHADHTAPNTELRDVCRTLCIT